MGAEDLHATGGFREKSGEPHTPRRWPTIGKAEEFKCRSATRITDPIRAGVGLRQGCTASPMLFRWVLQDTLEPLHTTWTRRGYGLSVDDVIVTHLAWADDTSVVNRDTQGLDTMLSQLSRTAEAEAGLEIRWEE